VFESTGAQLLRSQGPAHPNLIYVGNAEAKCLLGLGRADEARVRVERALASEAVPQVDPTLVAESKFLLAQALVGVDKPRAMELARVAQAVYRAHDPERWAADLKAIDEFLAR